MREMRSRVTATTATEAPRYVSYLLRLRWAERDGQPTCQAMLISVATKEQRSFGSLEEMMSYLHELGSEEAAPKQTAFAVD